MPAKSVSCVIHRFVFLRFFSGADSTGHPTISEASCSSSVGDVNIHFHGGAR